MGIELVGDEAPRIELDRPGDVRDKALFGPRQTYGRRNRIARYDVEVRDQAQRTVTPVLELRALGQAKLRVRGGGTQDPGCRSCHRC